MGKRIKASISKKHKKHTGGSTLSIPANPRKRVRKADNNPDNHELIDQPCRLCMRLVLAPADCVVTCPRCVQMGVNRKQEAA